MCLLGLSMTKTRIDTNICPISWTIGWLVVFYVPSTARLFRDCTSIYCPLRRTWSSVFTPFPPRIEPRAVTWQSITLPLRHASSTPNTEQNVLARIYTLYNTISVVFCNHMDNVKIYVISIQDLIEIWDKWTLLQSYCLIIGIKQFLIGFEYFWKRSFYVYNWLVVHAI